MSLLNIVKTSIYQFWLKRIDSKDLNNNNVELRKLLQFFFPEELRIVAIL